MRHEKAPISGAFAKAAGLGLEPRLPDPESGVLPLDDPARARRSVAAASRQTRARESDLEPVERHETLFGLRVDVRHDLDERLQAGAAELAPEQRVDLVHAGRVVHRDLDADR